MSKFLCIPRVRNKSISDEEIRSRIRDINNLCSKSVSNATKLCARRTKSLRGLIGILRDGKRDQLQLVGSREIVSCAIKILSYYVDSLHRTEGLCDWKRRRDYNIARICYYELVSSFVPEKSREIVCSIVDAIHEERLWQWEDLCWELTGGLLERGVIGVTIVEALLERVETSTTNFHDARAIVQILYEILDAYAWPKSHETVETIERLLSLYHASLSEFNTKGLSPYAGLRKGLEVCIRNAIKNLTNEHILVIVCRMCEWSIIDDTSDATILNFGSTLEYAAHMHDTRLYKDTLTSKIFPIIMSMMSSESRLVSLLGNRVMHHLLDRRDNRGYFDTPRVFFENTNFEIRVNRCDKEDKHFFQENREILHDSLVNGIMRHSRTRLNLESVYCTMCLIAVEVPCGFTAAALVCLVMNLQELTLKQTELFRDTSCHVHAAVMAIMSLLCWIHEAKVFYTYVNKIMTERAQWAPHLNPPIKSRYSYAIHHVLWDKPELFFVDWEARYGLWKCFRMREEKRRSTDDSLKRDR